MSSFLTKEGQKYGDFVLINCKKIDELQATLREMIHLPSGAEVMHIENDDPENVFCLSFKTLPHDSKGAPHILEHTALCGSKKFPVKDPFFSMSRRSLNTFMNALTGSDFTCYPAATQVEKDFYNLLEVYLDAVFHPKLDELSFLQEGHRLAFSTPDDPQSSLVFKGIVFNEMKGAMSSADSRIWQTLMHFLVPDLTYAYNSGGDPKEIPNLTYEELISFHETYYHPSRCLFYFYGNLPLQKHLDFIEENALKEVRKASPLDGIGHQRRFDKPVIEQIDYPAPEKEKNPDRKYIYAFAWLTTRLIEQQELLALTVLDLVLMDNDASPLKKVLLRSKMCVQAESFLDTEMTEIPFVFLFRGCKKDQLEPLKKLLFDTLEKISRDGLPYELIESAMHQLEFSRLEIGGDHSPFGLSLFMRSALLKQHGCEPENALILHKLFSEIREDAKDPHYFSPLIEKYLLHNSHAVFLSCKPNPHMLAKENDEEKTFLDTLQGKLSDKDKAKILEQTKHLDQYHARSETAHLDCLPKVVLSDVPVKTRDFPLQSEGILKSEINHHTVFTNHILYVDLVFDLPPLHQDELQALQLLISFWSELGAGNRDFEENLQKIHAVSGGVGAHASLHVQATDSGKYKPSIQFHGKALDHNCAAFCQLLSEMIVNPRFDEKERIKELILQLHSSLSNRLSRNAMRYATQIALSGFSEANYINELWYGLSYYQFIQNLAQNIDRELPKLLATLEQLKEKVFCVGTPRLVFSCDDDLYNRLKKGDFFGLANLPTKPLSSKHIKLDLPLIIDQAREIPSPVAFTSQAFKTVSYAHEDAPAMQIATELFANKILHHRIREQGGAYGAGATFNPLWGNFTFYGYRDPHLAHTLHCFRDAIRELSDGAFTDVDLEEAKLGVIQHFDTPISPGSRAMAAYVWQRDGKTARLRQTFRDRLLSLSCQEVQKALQNHLLDQMEKSKITSLAGKALLDKELPLLDERPLKRLSLLDF